MRVENHPLKKHAFRLFLFFSLCLLAVGVARGIAQNNSFVVENILQNDTDSTVFAVAVRGDFLANDVLNVYTGTTFIKSRVVAASEAGDDRRIVIENISLDVLPAGVNDIIVSIERLGVSVSVTPAYNLTIRNAPERPVIAVDREGDRYRVTVTGSFEEQDIVNLYINRLLDSTVQIAGDLVEADSVSLHVLASALDLGENHFEATITRSNTESERSSRETVTVAAEGESTAPSLPSCFRYRDGVTYQQDPLGRRYRFGSSVALRGNTIAVSDAVGKVVIYAREDAEAAWEQATTIAGGRYTETIRMPKSLVLDGGRSLLIGTSTARYRGGESGIVEVFTETGGEWSGTGFVVPEAIEPGEQFGGRIAADGSLLVIYAVRRAGTGGLYVYERGSDGVTWENPQLIVPSALVPNVRFGEHLSVDGRTIAVGVPGSRAVNVYTKSDTDVWVASRIEQRTGSQHAEFGKAVLIAGNTLVIGAPGNGTAKHDTGFVEVYERGSGGVWSFVQTVAAPIGARDFGSALSYHNGALAIGAPRTIRDNRSNVKVGAVYVYTHDGEGWVLRDTVSPRSLDAGDRFGASVALYGKDLVVGAPGSNVESRHDSGAVHVFSAAEAVCTASLVTGEDPVVEEPQPVSLEENVKVLQEHRESLEEFGQGVQTLVDSLSYTISSKIDEIARREERVVIFDQDIVTGEAQRRAAVTRGVVGPGLPLEVTAEQYLVKEQSIPTEPEIRSRVEVVGETLKDVGIIIPITGATLKLGDEHEDVYRLQAFLNQSGYPVATSGPGSPRNETSIFNEATEQALKRFQQLNGIEQTGILDRATRNVIFSFVGDFE